MKSKLDVFFTNFVHANAVEQSSIKKEIWAEYGAHEAVFILDMSGFSLMTQKFGIIHYLSMVQIMQSAILPIIKAFDGSLVKFEADNCFARFPTVDGAIHTGISINRRLKEINATTPKNFDVAVSCGIDFGPFLLMGDHDFFGDPVNRASKLGEDISEAGEILVTKEAMDMVEDGLIKSNEVQYSISGISIDTHCIIYES